MAITGKIWTAVLRKNWVDLNDRIYETVLDYNYYETTPAIIASLYPTLSWDRAEGWAPQGLRLKWLPQCYPTPSAAAMYDSDEEAMLDGQNFYETLSPNYHGSDGNSGPLFIRWSDGAWHHDEGYLGTPAQLWAVYPLANTYAITTAAPFGTGLGNGTIRHQALYWFAGGFGGTMHDTQYPNPPDPLPPDGDTGFIYVGVVDMTYIFTPVYDEGDNSPIDGAGDGVVATDDITLRVWGYSLDGHDFYVLRIGDSGTFVYDLTTRQWAEWRTPGRTNWRAHIGQNWVGCIGFNSGDTDVIAGDDGANGTGEGTLWQLSTIEGRDDRVDINMREDDKITKVVTGGIPCTGRQTIPCNAVAVTLALGAPTQDGAFIKLETSDDLGQTWTDHGAQVIVSGDFTAVVEWRGLGMIRAPGRIFRFTDDGASVRIAKADMR
jgi:hypothetical protein